MAYGNDLHSYPQVTLNGSVSLYVMGILLGLWPDVFFGVRSFMIYSLTQTSQVSTEVVIAVCG